MAVTTENSAQEVNRVAVPVVMAKPYDAEKVRFMYFSFVQGAAAGDANSLMNLVTLPGGNLRLIKTMCHYNCSAFGASRTLDVGYLAHTKQDGTAVAASIDKLDDGGDVSALANRIMGTGTAGLTADPTILFDSRDGVTIQAKVLGDTIPAAATLKGFIAYIKE
ncbi:hypothetical protein LCGC14_1141090 [marine sediment metagenome]|uniref:Uncharacterized protein n=1 Tax=marine sediment metagenome TaxID=412755 RepID=A0A0F9PGE6_9ZZZZ